jgi:2-keto-4-pentenoate hydratase/2-oxohepta-3-ene-1,7-dioic acid hydratase in catechol pathway
VELGVVVGRAGHRITRDVALDHPLLLQIVRGKGYPTFCPIGPWLVTPHELDLAAGLDLGSAPRSPASAR